MLFYFFSCFLSLAPCLQLTYLLTYVMRPLMLILLNSVNAVDVPTVISYNLFTCIHTSGCEMSELMFYLRSFCHCTKMSSMAIATLSPLSSSHIATLPHVFE